MGETAVPYFYMYLGRGFSILWGESREKLNQEPVLR
jgi:hypothetical protein